MAMASVVPENKVHQYNMYSRVSQLMLHEPYSHIAVDITLTCFMCFAFSNTRCSPSFQTS